ncbi:hypothetical protein HBI23_090690 [Parastagonospora nodorum]|nr:hypothetical protein HBI23_090690 [Parastagonospora nodorum]
MSQEKNTSSNCAALASPQNPGPSHVTSQFVNLLVELIDNIYRQLDNVRDVANLRLTCTQIRFSNMRGDTLRYLYQNLTFAHTPEGWMDYMAVAEHHVGGAKGQDYKSSEWVRRVVYEDVLPVTLDDLGLHNIAALAMEVANPEPSPYERYIDYVDAIKHFRVHAEDLIAVEAIATKFVNLDTIEYHSGFQDARQGYQPRRAMLNVIEQTADMNDEDDEDDEDDFLNIEVSKHLWKHRSCTWKTNTSPSLLDPSVEHVHLMVKAALGNPLRKAPLTHRIKTLHPYAFAYGYDDQQWPKNNKLHHVDIQYIGLNRSEDHDMGDYQLFRDPSTTHHFSNMRTLRLAGAHPHPDGSLNLQRLGLKDCKPEWPNLTDITLENVKLSSIAVGFVKTLKVHAHFRNVIWLGKSILDFDKGSEFLQVVVMGVHVARYTQVMGFASAWNSMTDETLAPDLVPVNLPNGDKPNETTDIFLVSYDQEGAQKLAVEYAPFCRPHLRPDGQDVPFVLPPDLGRYMMQGGLCHGQFWAEGWQD